MAGVGKWRQPNSLPACLSAFFTGTMNSKVSGREQKLGKLKVTTSSSFHQTTFFPIYYRHPANPFNKGKICSFTRYSGKSWQRKELYLQNEKLKIAWFGEYSGSQQIIWNCTSVSWYLNTKRYPIQKCSWLILS